MLFIHSPRGVQSAAVRRRLETSRSILAASLQRYNTVHNQPLVLLWSFQRAITPTMHYEERGRMSLVSSDTSDSINMEVESLEWTIRQSPLIDERVLKGRHQYSFSLQHISVQNSSTLLQGNRGHPLVPATAFLAVTPHLVQLQMLSLWVL